MSVTAVLTLASHVVLLGNALACCNTAKRLVASYVTVATTGVPLGQATVKCVAFTLEANMSRLNFAVSWRLVATSLTMGTNLAGVVKMTRGELVTLGVPRMGSSEPEPPQATSRHDSVATKTVSLI